MQHKPLIPTLESRERASGAKVATARREYRRRRHRESSGKMYPDFATRLLQGMRPLAQGWSPRPPGRAALDSCRLPRARESAPPIRLISTQNQPLTGVLTVFLLLRCILEKKSNIYYIFQLFTSIISRILPFSSFWVIRGSGAWINTNLAGLWDTGTSPFSSPSDTAAFPKRPACFTGSRRGLQPVRRAQTTPAGSF